MPDIPDDLRESLKAVTSAYHDDAIREAAERIVVRDRIVWRCWNDFQGIVRPCVQAAVGESIPDAAAIVDDIMGEIKVGFYGGFGNCLAAVERAIGSGPAVTAGVMAGLFREVQAFTESLERGESP
jgi:hypothetical protein